MTTYYVLMQEGWDYNDEIHFRPESGGGTPKKVFTNKKKAQEECDMLNVQALKAIFVSGEIREYCYSFDDLIAYQLRGDDSHQEKLDAVCTKIFGVDWGRLADIADNYHYYDRKDQKPLIKNTATDADWLEFLSCIKLNFWEVVTVEKG